VRWNMGETKVFSKKAIKNDIRGFQQKEYKYEAECGVCHRVRKIAVKKNGKNICYVCYHREILVARCSICGKTKTIAVRTNKNEVICNNCYQKFLHREECSVCHRLRTVVMRTPNSQPVCDACYRRQRRKTKVINWFLDLPQMEAICFIIETSRQRNKVSLRKLNIILESERTKKRLENLLEIILQSPAAKKFIVQFAKEEKMMESLINKEGP